MLTQESFSGLLFRCVCHPSVFCLSTFHARACPSTAAVLGLSEGRVRMSPQHRTTQKKPVCAPHVLWVLLDVLYREDGVCEGEQRGGRLGKASFRMCTIAPQTQCGDWSSKIRCLRSPANLDVWVTGTTQAGLTRHGGI